MSSAEVWEAPEIRSEEDPSYNMFDLFVAQLLGLGRYTE